MEFANVHLEIKLLMVFVRIVQNLPHMSMDFVYATMGSLQ